MIADHAARIIRSVQAGRGAGEFRGVLEEELDRCEGKARGAGEDEGRGAGEARGEAATRGKGGKEIKDLQPWWFERYMLDKLVNVEQDVEFALALLQEKAPKLR